MNKNTKKVFVILSAILLIGGIYGVVSTANERARERELEIAWAYLRLNYAFGMAGLSTPGHLDQDGMYKPLREITPEENRFGISVRLYLYLRIYEHKTGMVLAYETVVDYFSEEFEPDGSLRLYNNGNHPEIQAYVEWMWEEWRRPDIEDRYMQRIIRIYGEYWEAREGPDGWYRAVEDFWGLSPQMLDALVHAYFDPDYVLDLTSLQRAGY